MVRLYRNAFCSSRVTLSQTCDKTYLQSSPTDEAMLKYVFKYTPLVPSYNHQQCRITLWRWASDGEWTTGRPVAPDAVQCKFLGANKQTVVRDGWSSWRACVCSSVRGKDEKQKKWWWAVCSKRGQEASETDLTASLESCSCYFYHLSIPQKAFRVL